MEEIAGDAEQLEASPEGQAMQAVGDVGVEKAAPSGPRTPPPTAGVRKEHVPINTKDRVSDFGEIYSSLLLSKEALEMLNKLNYMPKGLKNVKPTHSKKLSPEKERPKVRGSCEDPE